MVVMMASLCDGDELNVMGPRFTYDVRYAMLYIGRTSVCASIIGMILRLGLVPQAFHTSY